MPIWACPRADFVLRPPHQARGHRLPIDMFFEELAAQLRELAVGVIFSGMGSDGTRGMQAIKQAGGLTLAQYPDTAKFDMMPQSAISAEVVDLIDYPEKMPEKIISYLFRGSFLNLPGTEPNTRNSLQEIVDLLSQHTGNSFTDYKINTVLRRIERRMSLYQITTMEAYVPYLRDNPAEIDLLFKEIADRRDQLFPRPESVGIPEDGGLAAIAGGPPGWPRLQGLDTGLLHRRGGLFAGDGVP